MAEKVGDGSEIEIVNFFGDVEIRPSDAGELSVDVKKTIRAANKEEADRLNGDFTFSIREEASKYRITSNRENGGGFRGTPRQRFKSSLSVLVPRRSALQIDNRNGRVILRELTGNQNIVNRYGDIEIRNITGEVRNENRNGSVTVEDVSDSVVINNRYSNTTVKNVGRDLQIQTRNGSVDVSGVKGNAAIDNSYAPISVENVQGEVTITGRNNSVDLQLIEGDIRADSSYQNVTIKDPRGAETVTSRNGDLLLSFDKAPQKDVSIAARYGNVTLEIPSGAAFNIDAHTQYGDVDSEFEGLSIDRSNRDKSVRGQFGQAGPHLAISTRNGNIRLNKRG